MKELAITGDGIARPSLRNTKSCAVNELAAAGNLRELRLQRFTVVFSKQPYFLRINISLALLSSNLDFFVELLTANFWHVALRV